MAPADLVRPDGYVPLTERLLPRPAWGAIGVVAAFAVLPFLHLLVVSTLEARALGVAAGSVVLEGLPTRLVNAYLIGLSFWGARRVAGQLAVVRALVDAPGPPATWLTWLLPPVVLDLVLAVSNELTRFGLLGSTRALEEAPTLATSFGLALLIRLPQMAAFWTVVVALFATARMPTDRLPASFPDDRSLGMRPVGELVLLVFVLFSAAFVPVFLVSDIGIVDFVPTIGLFVLGVTAMLLAVWRIHRSMAAERSRHVAAARRRFADAYRESTALADEPARTVAADRAVAAATSRLSMVEVLLRGAESIHDWPFDERMQRIAAIVMTGVITGLLIRAILLPFGS